MQGAGVPLNVWRGTIPSQGEKGERSFTTASTAVSKCVWDAEYRIGAVGDWLCDPSIEGAWLSGTALADHLGTYSIAGIESSSSLALSAHCTGMIPPPADPRFFGIGCHELYLILLL